MNDSSTPLQWSEREWLAFLLIAAADSDGDQDVHEMRFARVGLGNSVVDGMKQQFEGMSPESRDKVLQETLPERLSSLKSREKVQKLLKTMVLADGEYGPQEQALVKRISGWLRGN
jgi:uncharacterized tellurite resistance protein B-like protein